LKVKLDRLIYIIQRAYELSRSGNWAEFGFGLRRNFGRLFGPVAEVYSLVRDAILYNFYRIRLSPKLEMQGSNRWSSTRVNNHHRKNIIWIVLDALRQDIFYEYLRRGGTSDFLSKGAYFHRAFAQGSWTYPSIFSFITGRYPFNCGVSSFVLEKGNLLSVCTEFDDTIPTIFSILRNQGYQVGSILDGWGFTVRETAGQTHREDRYFEENWGWIYGQGRRFINLHDMRDMSLSFIRKSVPDKPFLLFIRSLYTHSPYRGIFKNPDYVNKLSQRRWAFRLVEGFIRGLRYFENIYLSSLVETLRQSDQLENTMIVICSDHGDMFWNLEDDLRSRQVEDEMWRHQLEPYNALIKVPLFIWGGEFKGVVPTRFRLMDLVPTLLDELEIDYHPEEFDGISLHSDGERRPLYADSAGYGFGGIALQKNDCKFLMSNRLGTTSYDISEDEYELLTKRRRSATGVEILTEFIQGAARANDIFVENGEKGSLRRRLKALGYL
jgi:hypothetical protein